YEQRVLRDRPVGRGIPDAGRAPDPADVTLEKQLGLAQVADLVAVAEAAGPPQDHHDQPGCGAEREQELVALVPGARGFTDRGRMHSCVQTRTRAPESDRRLRFVNFPSARLRLLA